MFILFSVLALMMGSGFAHDVDREHSALELEMETMEEAFRGIVSELRSGQLTEQGYTHAVALTASTEAAMAIIPSLATSVEMEEAYIESMTALLEKSQELANGFRDVLDNRSSDLAPLIQLWKEMNTMRKQGHKDFKAPE